MPLGDTFVWIIAEYIVNLEESKFQTLMKPRHLLTILALSPQASSLHDAVNYPVDGNVRGLAFSDSNIASNRYLYNGKKLEDYTLGTSYLGTLDYGARHYDPRIARWTVPDPMAEKYYGVNAYGYCAGDPVNRIVLYGSEWKTKEDKSIANNLSETITERQRALTLEKSRKENRLNKLMLDPKTKRLDGWKRLSRALICR